jgi:predicted small lipoprotein YifL
MKIKLSIFAVVLVLLALTGCCLAGLLPPPAQPPTSGPAVYLLNKGDLPEGSKLTQYQEVPHPGGTDYAVIFSMPDGLKVYSKVSYSKYAIKAMRELDWGEDTVRVDAPTVGQESMTFHGPVMGKPSVTVTFTQFQWEGMVQVIGSDDDAATDLAINFAQTIAARVPFSSPVTLSSEERADCYKTAELSISNIQFGQPVTDYKPNDAIFVMGSSPIDCGTSADVRLVDSDGKILKEQSFIITEGTCGLGDYNAARNLAKGEYRMEMWYGEILLKTINLTVR